MDSVIQLLKAYQTLYEVPEPVDVRFLRALERHSLRRTYRRRAMATHPDRAAFTGAPWHGDQADRFREIHDAYRRLSEFLRTGTAIPLETARPDFRPEPPRSETMRKQPGEPESREPRDWRTDGNFVPPHRLRFGEFLYFRGIISWRSLMHVLVEQRRARPRIGQIAARWNWVSETQIKEYLLDRRPGERLGELLVRHTAITPFRLAMLLHRQRKSQPRLGECLVRRGLLSLPLIEFYLRQLELHNRNWAPDRKEDYPFPI